MIRVMSVITRLNVGGAALHVLSLVEGLRPDRFRSILVSGRELPDEGNMLDLVPAQRVKPLMLPHFSAGAGPTLHDIRALISLLTVIRREQPSIVHTHTAKAGFIGRLAARIAGTPIVVHTYHGHVLQGYFSPAKSRFLQRLEGVLARISDSLVAVSERVRTDLVACGVAPAAKIRVIPLGFDLQPFLRCEDHKGEFRAEIGVDGARLVGIVGRIFPIKNHRLFLDAAANVLDRGTDVRFVIVGDGRLRGSMAAYAGTLGIADRVIFTGWRKDLPRIYADLDLLVVSSDNEGTPVSAIEAMASARPVVATRVGGLPDIVTEGETGFLVPPRDANALADAVFRVIGDPEMSSRMGRAARTIALDRFTTQRLISDVQNLYEELLAQKGIAG